MIIGSFKRWVGTFAAGALVLSGASLATAGPASAVPPAHAATTQVTTQVTQSDIRPNETTYKGWHEGYANTAPAYFATWNGLHLGLNDVRSQIINGLVDKGNAGLPVTGSELGALITGSTISVVSGAVFAQVAVTTDGTGGWGTLRPAVAATTSTQARLTDLWLSSKSMGTTVLAGTPMKLSDLLAALDAQGNVRYSAYGFLAMNAALVTSMTWGTQTFNFGPLVKAIPETSAVVVPEKMIRLDETTYSGWHEGVAGHTTPAFSVKSDGLRLGLGAKSQIVYGYDTITAIQHADLRSLLTSSQSSVASGVASFQVPVLFGSTHTFTTIFSWLAPGPGDTTPSLSTDWYSTTAILGTATTPAIAPMAPVALGDLIDALEANGSVTVIGFGFFAIAANEANPAPVVSSLLWNGVRYTFRTYDTNTALSGVSGSSFGAPMIFTATVSTVVVGGGTPDGEVSFWADATQIGNPVVLVNGTATFTLPKLPIGVTTITAKYAGSSSLAYLASEAKGSQTVTAAPTTITIPDVTGTLVGSDVVLTATVATAAGTPTGKVEFAINGAPAKSVDLVDGKASMTATNVQVGVTTVIARYLGSPTLGVSTTSNYVDVAFPTATGTPVEIYVQRVYRDLFGRNPDAAGQADWIGQLLGGTPRGEVANSITYSIEYRTGLINHAYAFYLGRTPEAAGLKSWLGEMDSGLTVAQMESGFVGSDEFYAATGGTDWGWVGQMYSDILGRAASPNEVNAWVHELNTGATRQQVSMGFLLSTEHLSTVVNSMYLGLLNRELDPSGQATWVGILQAGGRDEAIIAGIIASPEYFSKG